VPTVLGHALVAGSAYEAVQATPARGFLSPATWAGLLIVLSCAPDLDVAAFRWVPYEHLLGHRGLWHAPLFAAAFALLVALALCGRPKRHRIARVACVWLILAATMASHGLLDCLTDGGEGIALLAPISAERYFAPVQPIPVSPIGARALITDYGWRVFAVEVALFGPIWLAARMARRRTFRLPTRILVIAFLMLGAGASWAGRLVR
jgi:inner membrane protein